MITRNNIVPIHILIAEDQETDAFFIEQAFGKSEIENVIHWVKDGQEVMDFLRGAGDFKNAERPDMIFLDIKMPRKDGHETLAEIKRDPDLREIPVIMVSGSQAMDDVRKAYRNYANAYVSKANGFDDMLKFVDSIERFWFAKARLPQHRKS